MKQYLYFTLFIIAPFCMRAQEGFVQIYDMGHISNAFNNISLDNDTLLCLGVALDETTLKWGVLFSKIDTNGQVFFQRLYLDPDGNRIFMRHNSSIIKTVDGGYAMCGHDYTHAYFLKIDNQGEVEVFKSYEYDVLLLKQKKIIETIDGYLLCGTKQENDFSDEVYVKKIDKQGNEIWEQNYGMPNREDFMGSFLKVDENTYVIGYGQAYEESGVVWTKSKITAIDSLGNIKWEWASDFDDEFIGLWGLNPTEEGGWTFLCRYLEREPNDFTDFTVRYQFIKIDAEGEVEKVKVLDSLDKAYDKYVVDMIPTNDNTWTVIGSDTEFYGEAYSLSAWTYKLSMDGDSLWNRLDTVVWNGGYNAFDWSEAFHTGIVSLPSGSTISSGYTSYVDSSYARSFAFLIKLNKNGCITPGCNPTVDAVDWAQVASFKLYPNPASDWLKIEGEGIFDVEIYDMNGRLLAKKQRQQGVADFSISEWPNGQYAVRIRLGEYVVVNKMLVKGD